MVRRWAIWMMPAVLLGSCGDDDLATISIKVRSPVVSKDSIRRFPPNLPLPDRIRVEVRRSDDSPGPSVSSLDVAWSELEVDPINQKKYLLINVPANQGKTFRYLLRLSSVVGGSVDECGAIGQVLAAKGAKKQLEIATHLGDCSSTLCQRDSDCGGSQYCLSFECQDSDPTCECPVGAYCKATACAADCTSQQNFCTNDFVCCFGICAAHCPEP